ncbi:hypothetical protein [Nocardia sp. NPDC004860]|uniref:hypothetical protein n=1 Tax=Nocardia sp. NPDC004860 TaxID=3154557 RepID=UPI0033A6D031
MQVLVHRDQDVAGRVLGLVGVADEPADGGALFSPDIIGATAAAGMAGKLTQVGLIHGLGGTAVRESDAGDTRVVDLGIAVEDCGGRADGRVAVPALGVDVWGVERGQAQNHADYNR